MNKVIQAMLYAIVRLPIVRPFAQIDDKKLCLVEESCKICIRFTIKHSLHLLHQIYSDIPVNEQLSIRFVKFIQSLHNSDNHLSKICAQLAIKES